MDPFSAEGELINIHSHFHQGQYQEVVDFDTSSFSPDNRLATQILVLRARIALGQHADVLSEVNGASEPELQAVAALAKAASGDIESAASEAEKLGAEHGGNSTVQVVGGTVLAAAGKFDEALALLNRHEGIIDAVALIVQIHLQQNRNDLALKEVTAAKRWAQDSLLVNLAEAWVGMRLGGEKYQQAFYVFEELAQAPSTASIRTLVSQAIAELHLGRLEEAGAALSQALSPAVQKDPAYTEAIANSLVLHFVAGKDTQELVGKLREAAPAHRLLTDLDEKSSLFDNAAERYKAKAAA